MCRSDNHLQDTKFRPGDSKYRMMLVAHSKDADSSSLVLPHQTCQRFTLTQIQSATHNFDDRLVIGHGGFGKVYQCPITIGSVVTIVAIKRLDSTSDQGAREFEAEVKLLSKLRHPNLVSLIGYCNEEKEMVLVYEFMRNGTLKDHLHRADCVLSWLRRLQICIGVARALEYIHTGTATQQLVIHRDVKTSNILLDANYAAKVSDFGLAKVGPINQTKSEVSTAVKGTFGYLDPFYYFSGKLRRECDVYAFGVVLFEVLSGKKAVDSTLGEDQQSLAAWVQDNIKIGKLHKIMDSRLIGQISKKGLKEFAGIAHQCLHTQPKQRPKMAGIVARLKSILSREREFSNSVIDEGRFFDKVGYYLACEALRSTLKSQIESLKTFTFAELVRATNNFNVKDHSPTLNEIIYKGWVDVRTYSPTECGVGLAIYVTKNHVFSWKEQLDLKLEEFNHSNLVKLLGFCLTEQDLYCVYHFIPNATLDTLLYGAQRRTSLSWAARLKIALGAAQGLSFCHMRSHPEYSQFKTACILVDTDFNAQVDRSFAKYSCSFEEDASYAAPESFCYRPNKFDAITKQMEYNDDDFQLKSEIYSFGVVLLEILTGMKVLDKNRPQGKQDLVKWATSLLTDEENLGMIIDPHLLHDSFPSKEAFKLAVLISYCLERTKEKRPSMEEILQVLIYVRSKSELCTTPRL